MTRESIRVEREEDSLGVLAHPLSPSRVLVVVLETEESSLSPSAKSERASARAREREMREAINSKPLLMINFEMK